VVGVAGAGVASVVALLDGVVLAGVVASGAAAVVVVTGSGDVVVV